jgi:hypothetical protein
MGTRPLLKGLFRSVVSAALKDIRSFCTRLGFSGTLKDTKVPPPGGGSKAGGPVKRTLHEQEHALTNLESGKRWSADKQRTTARWTLRLKRRLREHSRK